MQKNCKIYNHSVNSSSHSVNGDIAIQWEWSIFDPSQNPNPLIDYNKTLHNWLRPWDKHVTQNLCQSAIRERLAKYMKYKASLFLFFPGLAYWSNTCMKFHARWFKTRVVTIKCLLGSTRFGVQIPQKPSKMAFYKHVRASANGLNTNDIIEDWRHWLAVAWRPSGVYYL